MIVNYTYTVPVSGGYLIKLMR